MTRQPTHPAQRSSNLWIPSALAIAACAGLSALQPARAANISSTWKAVGLDYNGNFSDTTHWTNGVPNDGDASSGDTANFTPDETYTVTFTSPEGSRQGIVKQGHVTFDLTNGGYTLSSTDNGNSGANASLLLGNGAGDDANLTVTGGALTTQNLYVGRSGQGALTLSGSDASLNTSGQTVYVGYYGGAGGELTIEGGASALTGATYLGHHSGGSTGSALVTGGGSTWDLGSTTLQVGYSGQGSLKIEEGGLVKSTVSNNIGSYTGGGTGSATVTGSDLTSHSTWENGGLQVGHYGTGALTVGDGGIIDSGSSTITLYSLGTLNLQGDSSITASALNSTGGALSITGTDNTITGNITLDSNTTTTMLLNSTADYAQLDVATGTFTAAGALNLNLGGSYTPTAGDTFDLFAGTIAGTFASISPLSGGFSWNINSLYTDGQISVQRVPEPAALGLLGLGAMALLARRRRQIL